MKMQFDFKPCLWAAMAVLSAAGSEAATSLGVQEPVPGQTTAQVPILMNTDVTAVAMQADILYDESLYTVSDALLGVQPEGVRVESQVIEPGTLRVVVYHRKSSAMGSNVLFQVPLTALAGSVESDPVVITNFKVAGPGGAGVATSLQPKVRLVGLKDGQTVNGRLGIEFSAIASAAEGSISKVDYFVGGERVGTGSGSNFAFRWQPPTSGPFEIVAVAYDSNGVESSTRTIPILVTHVGTFNGAVLGTYAGLVRGQGFSFGNDGYVSMTTTTAGAFTLKLMTGGKTFSSKGTFDAQGNAVVSVPRAKGQAALTVVLAQSSSTAVEQIHGRVADGTFSAVTGKFSGNSFETEFTVDRVVWNAKSRPATMAGNYTILLPAEAGAGVQGAPLGTGFATASVTTAGVVKVSASLADGTKATASSWVSKDGFWPVYASLYKNLGVLMGQLDFTSLEGISDVEGPLKWKRPADPKAAMFKPGFETTLDSVGGLFTKPAANQRLVPLANEGGNASLFLSEGGLGDEPIVRRSTVSAANKVVVPLQGEDRSAVTLTSASGLMAGSFFHPDTQKSVKFQGVVLQPQGLFGGYFLAGSQGGDVVLAPRVDRPPQTGDEAPLGTAPLPVVKIISPAANSTLKSVVGSVVQVKGTAADKQGISKVSYQILHNGELSAVATATGTAAWSFDISVPEGEGGLYAVHVKAEDTAGNESEVATAQFWTPLKKPLVVSVSGPGTVAKGFEGSSEREVGKLLTISAKPNAKKRFLGWTGSVVSSSPNITVLMKEGTSLQANFGE